MQLSKPVVMCRFTEALEAAMTCKIDTELVIPASPAQVWAVFGDFANWGEWNDFMVLPVPPKCVGKHCRVLFRLEGGLINKSVHDPEVSPLSRVSSGLAPGVVCNSC